MADCLPDERCEKRTGYAEYRSEDKSGRIVRPRREQARNDTRHETDDDNQRMPLISASVDEQHIPRGEWSPRACSLAWLRGTLVPAHVTPDQRR